MENFLKSLIEMSKKIYSKYDEYIYIEGCNKRYLLNYEELLSTFIEDLRKLKEQEDALYAQIAYESIDIYELFNLTNQQLSSNDNKNIFPCLIRIKNKLINYSLKHDEAKYRIFENIYCEDDSFKQLLDQGLIYKEAFDFIIDFQSDFINSFAHHSIIVINTSMAKDDANSYDYIKTKAYVAFTFSNQIEDDLIENEYREISSQLDNGMNKEYNIETELVELYLNTYISEYINSIIKGIFKLDCNYANLSLVVFKTLILYLNDDYLDELYDIILHDVSLTAEIRTLLLDTINNIDEDITIHNKGFYGDISDNLLDDEILNQLNEIARVTFKIYNLYNNLIILENTKDTNISDERKTLLEELHFFIERENELYAYFEDNASSIVDILYFFDVNALLYNNQNSSSNLLCQNRITNRLLKIDASCRTKMQDYDRLDKYIDNINYKNEELFNFNRNIIPLINKLLIKMYIKVLERELLKSDTNRLLDLQQIYNIIFENGCYLEEDLFSNSFMIHSLKLDVLNLGDIDKWLMEQYLNNRISGELHIIIASLSSIENIEEKFDEFIWFKTYLLQLDEKALEEYKVLIDKTIFKSTYIKSLLTDAINNTNKLKEDLMNNNLSNTI